MNVISNMLAQLQTNQMQKNIVATLSYSKKLIPILNILHHEKVILGYVIQHVPLPVGVQSWKKKQFLIYLSRNNNKYKYYKTGSLAPSLLADNEMYCNIKLLQDVNAIYIVLTEKGIMSNRKAVAIGAKCCKLICRITI